MSNSDLIATLQAQCDSAIAIAREATDQLNGALAIIEGQRIQIEKLTQLCKNAHALVERAIKGA